MERRGVILVSNPFELFVLRDGSRVYAREKTAATFVGVRLAAVGYPPNLEPIGAPESTLHGPCVESRWPTFSLIERHELEHQCLPNLALLERHELALRTEHEAPFSSRELAWVESVGQLEGWTLPSERRDRVRCDHELIVEKAPTRGEHFHWLVLSFALANAGELRRNATNTAVGVYDPRGNLVVMFEQPSATDASDTPLRTQFSMKQGGLWVEVNDFGATYPITIRTRGAEPHNDSGFRGPKVA